MDPSGYSGTPLEKKLGFKPGFTARLIGAPDHYFDLFKSLPEGLAFTDDARLPKDFIHWFVTDSAVLLTQLPAMREEIRPDGMIWVSWPKKASKVPTDITEDVVRGVALSVGLVDVKVCAVDAVWSGLKLVVPLKGRGLK